MILVTGATGLVGRALVMNLLAAGAQVRALSRHPKTGDFPDDVEVVAGDLGDPATLSAALAGVDAVYMFSAGRPGRQFATVAQQSGVQRVVAVSGFDSDPNDTEPWLAGAGLEWTHLLPTAFASNALRHWGHGIRAENLVRAPYPEAQTAPIHEADIAAVAAAALLDDRHTGQRYELTGPQSLTFRDQVAAIADATGREISFIEETPEQARERFTRAGIPEPIVDQLLTVWAGLVGHPATVSATVHQVTGRPAHTFAQWARDHVADFN